MPLTKNGVKRLKKVTIQDVAKELNLSRNTVAKALNNSDTVAYETRYVVIKKAYEMGYSKLSSVVLNEFKIKEKYEKSKTIVVLARRELSSFWNHIIMGISDELNKNNCKLQFNFISDQDEENKNLPLDLDTDINGIIMLSVFRKDYIDLIMKKDVPVVFLDAPSNVSDISKCGDIVIFEGLNSTKALIKHLAMRGMKKIGFIGDITYCKTILDRYQGFVEGMKEAGLDIDEEFLLTRHMPYRYYRVDEVHKALGELKKMPEAFCCANDDIARDVILFLRNKGLRVPEDVAVTGFDDKEEAAIMMPALTTVHIGNQRMGKRLVQQLMWRIENTDMPKEIVTIHTDIVIRQSSLK